jgi:voltage-gated potassium channel
VVSSPSRKLGPPLRLLLFGSVLVLLIAIGTVGYRAIEAWSWFDAFFKSVSLLTSLGSDLHPLSTRGRMFTIVLALFGIFTVALAATEVLRIIVTGELREYLEGRRMGKRIDDLERHVIVCGYGRVGRHACADLAGAGVPVVVIDRQDTLLAAAREAGAHPVSGDASADVTLRRAGIERARALVAAAGTDPDNVLITMTARLLHPTLPIVARAAEEATVPKLLRAGATRTISPYAISGRRMAYAVLRPTALDLLEVVTRTDLPDLHVEERVVHPGGPLDGQTVGASGIRSRPGLILVAIKRQDGEIAFNPGDAVALAAGDTLIILGGRVQAAAAHGVDRARRVR